LTDSDVFGEFTVRFVHESRFPGVDPATVFALHERPGALERLTPPWEKVRVQSTDGSIQPGSRVVLCMDGGVFRMTWHALHTVYDPPREFVDIQESGPFRRWEHHHRFLPDGEGGTILRDEIEYELPLGRVGAWLGGGFVERKLRRMFEYRHQATRDWLLEG
jgi:uncharacterized protein